MHNIYLVKKMRHANELAHQKNTYDDYSAEQSKTGTSRPKTTQLATQRNTESKMAETLRDLRRKTDFRTQTKQTVHEQNVVKYLENWHGTEHGLVKDWDKQVNKVQSSYREKCLECDRYRCSH